MAEDPSTVGEMNGQATAGHNVQRDAWKSIRTHIHRECTVGLCPAA